MTQTTTPALHIRMPSELREALEQAAKAEDQPQIIADWLKRQSGVKRP